MDYTLQINSDHNCKQLNTSNRIQITLNRALIDRLYFSQKKKDIGLIFFSNLK